MTFRSDCQCTRGRGNRLRIMYSLIALVWNCNVVNYALSPRRYTFRSDTLAGVQLTLSAWTVCGPVHRDHERHVKHLA
jgi:hypothetical protein